MKKALEIAGMVKSYPDFQLGPLQLDLDAGMVLGYIGPNGAGKTTTMHCLTGLVKADSGSMRIFGRQNRPTLTDWKLDIGYVGDVHVFYERWSAAKNLKFLSKFYPNWSDTLTAKLAERFQLPLNKKAKELSTGNRVKLSLVAALSHSPKLLLLDEPTAGLDPVVRAEVLDTLFEILEDGERAIFYSTHILSDISRLADELAFLVDGRITLRSTKDDLVEKWRRISFKIDRNDKVKATVEHKREGMDHQVVSRDFLDTIAHLRNIGATDIHDSRMTIDEIAVYILKGGQ